MRVGPVAIVSRDYPYRIQLLICVIHFWYLVVQVHPPEKPEDPSACAVKDSHYIHYGFTLDVWR